MIAAFTTIAVILSLAFGILMYRSVFDQVETAAKNGLLVNTSQLCAQLDDQYSRMDAIVNYILSDADLLRDIYIIGRAEENGTPSVYVNDSIQELSTGLRTDFIRRNSYYVSFVYRPNSSVSSTEYQSVPQCSSQVFAVPYLDGIEGTKGRPVLLGKHTGYWQNENSPEIYSLVKEVQGRNLGYIEVSNPASDFQNLSISDPAIRYSVILNQKDVVYSDIDDDIIAEILPSACVDAAESSTSSALVAEGSKIDNAAEKMGHLSDEVQETAKGDYYVAVSSKNYSFTIVALLPSSAVEGEKASFAFSTFIVSMVILVACIFFIIVMSHMLVRPIRELTDIVEQTDLSNLNNSERIVVNTNIEEINSLANSYKEMTERVSTSAQKEKRASVLQLQAQFDALQTQVNPHFIYNVMNIISAKGALDDDEEICNMCAALSAMLRYSTNVKERYATIGEEISELQNYIYLLKARYEDRIRFTITVNSKVRSKIIPKLTIQQIIENSVKYCMEEITYTLEINVTGRQTDAGWAVTVQDNGPGFSEKSLAQLEQECRSTEEVILHRRNPVELEIGGMGLVNAYARLLLLYGPDASFNCTNNDRGAVVTIAVRED